MMMHAFATSVDCADALADRVRNDISAAIDKGERTTVVVPGGATPELFLRRLAASPLPWESIVLLPSDERWVPPDAPGSNEAMIRSAMAPLGGRLNLESLWRSGLGPDQAVLPVTDRLAHDLPSPCAAVLGVGLDGHIASLFSDTRDDGRHLCLASHAPTAPAERLSLGLAYLAMAGWIYLLTTGDEKVGAINKALGDSASPLGRLASLAGEKLHHYHTHTA